jgi:hypothetical protein
MKPCDCHGVIEHWTGEEGQPAEHLDLKEVVRWIFEDKFKDPGALGLLSDRTLGIRPDRPPRPSMKKAPFYWRKVAPPEGQPFPGCGKCGGTGELPEE